MASADRSVRAVLGNACVVALGDMDARSGARARVPPRARGWTWSRSFVERTLKSQAPEEKD
jgi:hypothetical protein